MSKLQFDYWTEFRYTEPVTESHYTFKCLPKDTDMQSISRLSIELVPEHDCQRGTDSFGNLTVHDDLYLSHDYFSLRVTGMAETGLAAGDRADGYTGLYRYPYGLNRAGEGIRAYFSKIMAEKTEGNTALYLMNCLHRDFIYEKGVTHVGTTAEEAYSLGRGVCQDYAHIFIALCHLAGLTARYVTGMMVGEGYSHAWVEVLSDGVWLGYDPTNGCAVGGDYIKIAAGRDANDCVINKGIMKGGGWQQQSVSVRVDEIL